MIASQKMMKQANYLRAMGDDEGAIKATDTARRLQTTATLNMSNAKKEYQKSVDDALESVYGAKSQQEYDQRVKDALERTGIPTPKNLPEIWTPDLKEKILSAMSPEARNRIQKEQRAEDAARRAEKSAELRDERMIALLRGGGAGGKATCGAGTYITWAGTGTRYGSIS